MSQSSNSNGQYVRRVTLPSGRSIEVVYFEPLAAEAAGAAHAPHQLDDLHICPECDRDLVYPVDWEEAGASHWQVTLRCPNCEWVGTGVFEQEVVEAFDEELDRGTETLVRDFKTLIRANMEEQVERFAEALQAGLILPEDF